jgi:hypothetical protein
MEEAAVVEYPVSDNTVVREKEKELSVQCLFPEQQEVRGAK